MRVRRFQEGDAPALWSLFRVTVRRVNVRDYSPEQVRAWAPDAIDAGRWADSFAGRYTAVVELEGEPVGFGELEPNGHIDRFYVHADHQRRGVGREIMAALLAEARRAGLTRLFAEMSLTALPFFERQGFVVLQEQSVVRRGVAFTNFRMERRLDDA